MLNLETLALKRGSHSPDSEYCVMEAVAYMAGEPWSDSPACASPVIAAFLRTWNDGLDDAARQALKRYIPRLLHSAATPAVEAARGWLAMDWLIRVYTPTWLRAAGLTAEATTLAELELIQTTADFVTAQPRLDAARHRATAAWATAAGAAAGAAARDAAGAAAWDAAWDAAGAAVAPTIRRLQASAHDLVDRMLAMTEEPRAVGDD